MALNFSHRPIFPGGLSEDNLVAPMRIGNGYRVESIQERSGGDGYGRGWHDVENCFDYGVDRCDRAAATQDSVSKDILDVLPSDPFGMDISTTFTAITGWLEDLEVDYGGYSRDELAASDNRYPLFAGWNIFWNKAMRFHGFPTNNMCAEEMNPHRMSGFGECSRKEFEGASYHLDFGFACDGVHDDVLGFGCDYKDVGTARQSCQMQMHNIDEENRLGGDEPAPHPAMSFALSYLELSDLLAVECVCKSLHSTARGDPLLWRSIHIVKNEKLTDDILLQLTNRAQGNLQCLSLVECPKITDDGLKRVLEANPKLTKLSIPGCTRVNIDGIVGILKAFKSMGTLGVKHFHIGGLYGVTQQHYEELKLLLGADDQLLQHSRKPHFYRGGNSFLSCDDDRAIDIEVCPNCQNLRLVYDCPTEGCKGVGHATQVCRACTLCIPRCTQCGCCINDSEYEETFCLEILCCSCSNKRAVKCTERTDCKVGLTKSVGQEQR